jgi:hypothetical protein
MKNSPTVEWLLAGALALLPLPVQAVNPTGRLDSCDAEFARGYAKDNDAPGGQVYVQFYLDATRGNGGVYIGQVFATNFYAGQGNYGFAFPIPPSAHTGPSQRKIYAYAVNVGGGNDKQLSGSGMLMGDMLYLDNGTVKVGMKLTWGGSITELWYNGVDVIDNWDAGREVQCAFYAAGEYYSPVGDPGDPNWGWDPVQGGDKYSHGSGIVTYTRNGTNSIYLQTRPMEWNPDNKGGGSSLGVRSTVVLDQWITISDRAVYCDYGVQNDATPRGSTSQEMPCVYTTGAYNDLIAYYGGTSPWTSGAMTTVVPTTAAALYNSLEYMLFIGDTNGNNGITLLDLDNSLFAGHAPDVVEPAACGYIRCHKAFALPANGYVARSCVLVPGDYTSARSYAYGLGIGRREWNFNTAGNAENWQPNAQITGLTVSGGTLTAQSTGVDPYMYSPDITLCAAVQPRIEVRMSATAGASAKFYFITDADTAWDEAKSVTVAINPDGLYRSHYFDMAANGQWAGRIRQLRFDPTTTAGTFSIDYIRAAHTGGQQWLWNTDGDTEGWTAINHISGLTASNGVLSGITTGIDPYMRVSGLNIEAAAVTQAEIRLKTSAGSPGQFFWTTDVEPTYSASKAINFTLTSDNQFHTYYVPIGTNALWQGKVTGFRLDPTSGGSNVTFEVDYIRLASATGAAWEFNDDNNLENWRGINAGIPTVAGGTLSFTGTNADPYFIQQSSDLLLSADLFKTLQVTMQTATPSSFQVYFNRFSDPATFSESRKISFVLNADNTMRTYTFNMGTHADWNGLIRDVRIDPLSAVGSASIDTVRFLP